MSLTYEERVKRSAEKSRQLSRAGRDIYPLPPIRDPQQRLRCRDNLRLFLETYLKNWYTKPFGEPHLTLIASLQDILVNGGRQAVSMPRGSGKSTVVCGAILWALLNGHRRYICILGASSKASKKFISLLGATLSTAHTPLSYDYPEATYPIQQLGGSAIQTRGQHYRGTLTRITLTADTLVLPTIPCSPCSGSRVVAMGISSALRGQSSEAPDGTVLRPDTVLMDDIQNDADAISPSRVEKLTGLVNGVVKGLSRSGERLAQIITCTVISPDDWADRVLSDPLWRGLRTSALKSMPTNMDAWRTYRDILFDRGEQAARVYYRENYATLTEGAEASWPQDYDPTFYEDACHYNMHLWAENEKAFYSERQNEPQRPSGLQTILSAPQICKKLSYVKRYSVHENTHKITCALDIHDDILYYATIAFQSDYTASICDYGSYPHQNRPYFFRGSGIVDLQRVYGGEPASNVLAGLTELLKNLSEYRYSREGGGEMAIERVLVDSGWRSEIVHEAIRRANWPAVMACKGVSIRANQRPMSEWTKKTGRVKGWHITEERIENKHLLLIDVNYWKSRLFEGLSTPAGKAGELSLYGDDPAVHKMLADHLTSEIPRIEEMENTVVYWSPKPSTENHLLDCCTYAYAAATSLGLKPSDCIV